MINSPNVKYEPVSLNCALSLVNSTCPIYITTVSFVALHYTYFTPGIFERTEPNLTDHD